VLKERTLNIVVVLENIRSRGNENAVYRSMDALGFQEVHSIVTGKQPQQSSGDPRTDAGARKWLSIRRWDNTNDCLFHLRSRGYRIVATTVGESEMCVGNAVPVSNISFKERIAVLFGCENEGISKSAMQMSDVCCFIPMFGFTRSFNVSVAVALTLYEARMQRITKLGKHGDLTKEESQHLCEAFYRTSITKSGNSADVYE
jgi:tRNA G18 (ribose-2'-O)-methylase SpoU